MDRMDKEQPVFELLTLRDFKKWSFTELKAHCQVWDNFGNWNPFENDEKYFLFHLKSSSRSHI